MFSLARNSFWFCTILMVVEMTCFVLQIFFMSIIIKFLQEYADDDRSHDLTRVYLAAFGIAMATVLFVPSS
jgi:ABC-type enterochelin transport system permease subunit